MEIAPISTNTAMATAARQLGTQTGLQAEMMKQIADNQEQMADILHEQGVGRNLDIKA